MVRKSRISEASCKLSPNSIRKRRINTASSSTITGTRLINSTNTIGTEESGSQILKDNSHELDSIASLTFIPIQFKNFYVFRLLQTFSKKFPLEQCLLGAIIGILYFWTICRHFQSLTGFSTLTNLEKQLSLPTETAFRYSFFKRIAEEDSLFSGLRSVIYDTRTNGQNVTNSFEKYALFPEAFLGGIFHIYKGFWSTLGFKELAKCWQGSSGIDGWEDWKCSGLGDPLTFYFISNWFIDSVFVAFLHVAGSLTGDSAISGIFTSFTYILNHPQLGNWEQLFPVGERFGTYLAMVLIFLVPRLLFTKSHPSWTPVVKLSVSIGLLVICWPFESQWLLTMHLLITCLLHFTSFLSPFLTSIVLSAHIVGWEYGSLMSLDPTLRCWTFYLYLFVGSLAALYLLRPVVDSLFGDKLQKWMFLRILILFLGVYVVATELRRDIRPTFQLQEDPRMSRYLKSSNITSNHEGSFGGVSAFKFDKTLRPIANVKYGFHFNTARPPSPSGGGDNWLKSRRQSQEVRGESQQNEDSEDDFIESEEDESDDDAIVETFEESFEYETAEEVINDDSTIEILPFGSDSEETLKESSEESATNNMKKPELFQKNSVSPEDEKLGNFLAKCHLNKMIPSISKVIMQNLLPIIMALAVCEANLVLIYRDMKNQDELGLPEITTGEQEDTKDQLRLLLYHGSHTILIFLLTIFIHGKFQLLFLAQLSLFSALLPQLKKFNWLTERWSLQLGRRTHVAFIFSILALMTGVAKMHVDRLYVLPQQIIRQGDPAGIGELLETMKYIRESLPRSHSRKSFLGPPTLMTDVYLSGQHPVTNHNGDPLPYLNPIVSPESLILAQLFNKFRTINEFHENLLRQLPNSSYLLINHEFCSNPLSPREEFSFTAPGQLLEDIVDPDEDILTVNRRYAPQRRLRHHNADLLQKYSPNGNGKSSKQPIEQGNGNFNAECDLSTFWDDLLEPQSGRGTLTGGSETVLCFQLLDEGTYHEILPFRRLFQNRLYTILNWS